MKFIKQNWFLLFIALCIVASVGMYIWAGFFADCNNLGWMSIETIPTRCFVL